MVVVAIAVVVVAVGVLARRPKTTPPPAVVPVETSRTYRVFFTNDLLDPDVTCQTVFPIVRDTNYEGDLGRAAIEDLVRGPTAADRLAGYGTALPTGVTIKSLELKDGSLKIDLSSELDRVGGSCRVSLIRKQIEETAKALSGVGSVTISVEGRTDDILQP